MFIGMALPRKKPARCKDVLAAPEHLVAEIVDDELYLSPPPASPHAVALSNLTAELLSQNSAMDAQRPGGWVILAEPELHIVGQVMVPDLAGWRRERMPEVRSVPFFRSRARIGCARWSLRRLARSIAPGRYRTTRGGRRGTWLVDPTPKTLELYRLDAGGWRLEGVHEGDTVVNVAPFDAVSLDLERLWAC
jgi:hypothetical protein